jgi:hypothetical protein
VQVVISILGGGEANFAMTSSISMSGIHSSIRSYTDRVRVGFDLSTENSSDSATWASANFEKKRVIESDTVNTPYLVVVAVGTANTKSGHL